MYDYYKISNRCSVIFIYFMYEIFKNETEISHI